MMKTLSQRFSDSDSLAFRYSYSQGTNVNPISIRGSDLPGFPVQDDLATHGINLSETIVQTPKITYPRLRCFYGVAFEREFHTR